MSTFTKIDGIFGSGTLAALKAAGYGSSIDAATFQKIASLTGSSTATPVSSQNVGVKLYEYATQKNLEGVLSLLRQLQSVADYSAANKVFIDQQSFSVSRSIVTYLLDAFAFNDAARDQIKQEFLRIGLRLDNSTGKWSLSGFSGFKDIMTITDTYVQHASGQRFAVPRNTILGEQLRIANGMTTFRAIDGSEFSTPTQSVKYA